MAEMTEGEQKPHYAGRNNKFIRLPLFAGILGAHQCAALVRGKFAPKNPSLCNTCNGNQALIVHLLANFKPTDEVLSTLALIAPSIFMWSLVDSHVLKPKWRSFGQTFIGVTQYVAVVA